MEGRDEPVSRWREGLRAALLLGVVAASVSGARASLADHYVVPSGSMRPTLVEGDRIVVDKMAFGIRVPLTDVWLISAEGPVRGDVVVLRSPEHGDTLVKRVMGLPGETIAVRAGAVFVDGVAVEPPGLAANATFGPITLGRSEYLVLGDNRGNSHDGRHFGPVSRASIHGRVEAVVWRHGGLTWRTLGRSPEPERSFGLGPTGPTW